MATYTIYGDLLFLTNLLMDFTLLYGVSRFGNFRTGLGRLLLGAVCGAAYGVMAVTPSFFFLNYFVIKLLASALIVKVAFFRCSFRMYLKAFAYFYFLSFAMAGAVMAVSWLTTDSLWQGEGLPYTALALSAAFLLILVLSRLGVGYIKETLSRNASVQPIQVVLGDKKVEINTLLDTGNELIDPITHCPVLVAEFDALKSLFPLAFSDAWRQNPQKDAADLMGDFLEEPIGKRLRLIPFSSIGKRNGLMLGVQPDYIVVMDKKNTVIAPSVICLYRGSLHTKDQCRCIMNPLVVSKMENHACSQGLFSAEQ